MGPSRITGTRRHRLRGEGALCLGADGVEAARSSPGESPVWETRLKALYQVDPGAVRLNPEKEIGR